MPRLSLRNVTKKYPNNDVVVKNFSLDIEDGEFVVLTGMEDCGKTLIIRMIAGLEEINSGEIVIDGEVVNDMETRERGVAMVFQNYTLYPGMNVHDNIAFALKLAHVPVGEIDRRVKETAEFLEMEDLLEKMPEVLSEAETLRAVVGRAIAKKPKVLLMDDTLARLTGEMKQTIEKKMVDLSHRLGIPFVYATQCQEEAMAMASRIVVLKEGEIQQEGSPKQLYEKPANSFVALFLGQPPMNMIHVRAEKVPEGMALKFGKNKVLLPQKMAASVAGKGYEGKDVFMGIRPEDTNAYPGVKFKEEPGMSYIIAAEVEDQEEVFGTVYLRAILDDTVWIALAGEKSAPAGSIVNLAFRTEKIHIFCAETGEAVC